MSATWKKLAFSPNVGVTLFFFFTCIQYTAWHHLVYVSLTTNIGNSSQEFGTSLGKNAYFNGKRKHANILERIKSPLFNSVDQSSHVLKTIKKRSMVIRQHMKKTLVHEIIISHCMK